MCYAAVFAAIGAGVSAAGAYQQGQNAKKVGRYNAQMGEFKAKDAIQRGQITADEVSERARREMAARRAAYGTTGVEGSSGSAAGLFDEAAVRTGVNVNTVYANAQREAWGYRSQVGLDLAQGDNAASAANMSAFGTILGGASRAWELWPERKPKPPREFRGLAPRKEGGLAPPPGGGPSFTQVRQNPGPEC